MVARSWQSTTNAWYMQLSAINMTGMIKHDEWWVVWLSVSRPAVEHHAAYNGPDGRIRGVVLCDLCHPGCRVLRLLRDGISGMRIPPPRPVGEWEKFLFPCLFSWGNLPLLPLLFYVAIVTLFVSRNPCCCPSAHQLRGQRKDPQHNFSATGTLNSLRAWFGNDRTA